MTFIQQGGAVTALKPPWWTSNTQRSSLQMYDRYYYDYATLYRLQPNIRTVVDFLARNIAQLGLHVYRRISDNDRERLFDHQVADILRSPLPARYKVTQFRLMNSVVSDLGIYFNAYWLKIKVDDRMSLLRIPPDLVTPIGGMLIDHFDVVVEGRTISLDPDEVVHFYGYNPESPIFGLSPLETLRRVLAEEFAAGDYRESFWRNAARIGGVVERPLAAPEWSDNARSNFLAGFEALYSGKMNSGRTVVLEDGMTWKDASFNPRDSEYLSGRKLTREECARAYHIPPPLVGILDHATFSNITEQHKSLYTDTLGPWLKMIESDIQLQLMGDFEDSAQVYVEFNIAEKLRGNFEEQVKAIQTAVGRPWMTVNEARGRLNMPMDDAPESDELVTPLNVSIGGQASPTDSIADDPGRDPGPKSLTMKRSTKVSSNDPSLRLHYESRFKSALRRHYERQQRTIVSRVPKSQKADIGGVWFDETRWNEELFDDLLPLNLAAARAWAKRIAKQTGVNVSESWMLPWIRRHSEVQAANINREIRDQLDVALNQPEQTEAVKKVFDQAITTKSVLQAGVAVLAIASFGTHEGARAGGMKLKTWVTNSADPRSEHQLLNGETVEVDEPFSNGMMWPGDPIGGAKNNSNCQCTVEFSRRE